MSASLPCPGCGTSVRVKDANLGRRVSCPHCGTGFTALQDETDRPAEDFVADYYLGTARTPPLYALLWTLCGVAVFGTLAMIGVALAVKANAEREDPHPQAVARSAPESPRPSSRPNPPPTPTRPAPVRESSSFRQSDNDGAEAAAVVTVWAVVGFIVVLYVVCEILMLAWVAKDSRARGVDGGAVWVFLVLLTGLVGLLVYMASRPHGVLVACATCTNKRLMYAKLCPHCGNA